MLQAAQRIITPAARADTPAPHVHPRSASAIGRARFCVEQAKRCLIAAEHHRLESRPSWSRGCLASAGVARRQAAYELRDVRREG